MKSASQSNQSDKLIKVNMETQLQKVPSFYVEGVSQMMVGFPISRLMLYTLAEKNEIDPTKEEVRHIACELIMPTSALIEMAQNIISSLSRNKSLLENAKSEWSGKIDNLISTLSGTQPIPEDSHKNKQN